MRYINQGRPDGERSHLSPRNAARLLLTNPADLSDAQQATLAPLSGACVEMKALTNLISTFAGLLTPADGNGAQLDAWITAARDADLPNVHSFTRGLDFDRAAVCAALTLSHHNGRTEGVNNKTKLLKRQMYGRAGFDLLRHRILLN